MSGITAETAGTVRRLRDGMAGGVLSFPLTSFRDDCALGLEAYRVYPADRRRSPHPARPRGGAA